MLFRIKKQIYKIALVLLINCSLIAALIAGTDFAAIGIPQALHQEFIGMQQYVAHRLRKSFTLVPTQVHNLHITLKEIGELNHHERETVRKTLKKVAKQFYSHSIAHIIKAGRLRIRPDGLVLLKIKSDWLTALAHNIDASLKTVKKQKKLRTLLKRMDFPHNGHITLGQIMYKHKPADKNKTPADMTAKIEKKFKNQFNSGFNVDRFVLLKSNSPLQPRIYSNKGTFYL